MNDKEWAEKRSKMLGERVTQLSCFECRGRGTVMDLEDGPENVCPTCNGRKKMPVEEWKKALEAQIKYYDSL